MRTLLATGSIIVAALLLISLTSLLSCAEQYVPDNNTIFVSSRSSYEGDGSFRTPFTDLQQAIDAAKSGDKIMLLPGIYKAKSEKFVEDLCGNCLNAQTQVYATRGFLIDDKAVTISGKNADSCVLVTNSGYGVLFLHSDGSVIENVKITGGVRDADGNATDAAIVAKFSHLTVRNCNITDNDNRDTTVVVGIGGVFGREGSELFVQHNHIIRGGWDGIALYRGAKAFIEDNIIDEGRGAGVGVTWDATATVLRNRISRYWKGIGAFGTSRVVARNNIVKDCVGWGIIATGQSYLDATNNVIFNNGNCGFANWGDKGDPLAATGIFENNVVMDNGWRDEWVCPQVGVWMLGDSAKFQIAFNNVVANVAGNYRDISNLTGINGNVSFNPMFADTTTFKLKPGSPLIDSGDSLITDLDGTRSDIGVWGGGSAGE